MNWLSQLKNPGHITEAVAHFNQACDKLQDKASNINVSALLFNALNKIQTELSRIMIYHLGLGRGA